MQMRSKKSYYTFKLADSICEFYQKYFYEQTLEVIGGTIKDQASFVIKLYNAFYDNTEFKKIIDDLEYQFSNLCDEVQW